MPLVLGRRHSVLEVTSTVARRFDMRVATLFGFGVPSLFSSAVLSDLTPRVRHIIPVASGM